MRIAFKQTLKIILSCIQHAWLLVVSFWLSHVTCRLTIQTAEGSVNQLPPWTEVQGDIRLTPFYDIDECVKKVEDYVAELNKGQYNVVWLW